jgi:hypothetical protein
MIAKLNQLGFNGPVIAEPFSDRLNTLAESDPVAAATETSESIKKLFKAAGIPA